MYITYTEYSIIVLTQKLFRHRHTQYKQYSKKGNVCLNIFQKKLEPILSIYTVSDNINFYVLTELGRCTYIM